MTSPIPLTLTLLALSGFPLGGCRPAPVPPAPVQAATSEARIERLKADWEADRTSLEAAVALAEAYRAAEQSPKAEEVYNTLLKGGSPFAQGVALNALAQILAGEGRQEEAYALLWQSREAGTPATQSQAWLLMGDQIRASQTIPAGLTDTESPPWPLAAWFCYDKAVETGVPSPEVFAGLAELDEKAGLLPAALENWRIHLAGDPSNMEGWLKAADLATRLGELEHAKFYLEMVSVQGSAVERRMAEEKLAGAG